MIPLAAPPVLYADRRYVVLDKPPGLKVHPGPAGGPSVEDWFPALSRRADGPWLAHRLDADTAGCLLVALRKQALREAQACFAEGRARKTYWAIVHGRPATAEGIVDVPLRRVSTRSAWHMQAAPGHPDAQPAITQWRLRGTSGNRSWLELHPRTGRTHQIRVHCASLGLPLLGDPLYGPANPAMPMHLLARGLVLPLDPPLAVTARPPAGMREAFGGCGWEDSSFSAEKEAKRL